jgi:hypothetical protein
MSTNGRGSGSTYRLVLGGELGDRFVMLFEGMCLSREGGNTVLTGPVTDQAHLAGIIERTQELGLKLISVGTVEQTSKDAAGSSGIVPTP